MAAGLTQQEIARLLGISQTSASQWESGERDPNVSAVIDWLDVCGFAIVVVAKGAIRSAQPSGEGLG